MVVDLAGATTRLPEPVAEISPEVMGEEATAEADSALVAEDSLEAEVVEEADSVACLVVAMAAVVAVVLAVVAMEAKEEAKEVEEATEVDSVLAAERRRPRTAVIVNPLQSNLSIILHHRGLFDVIDRCRVVNLLKLFGVIFGGRQDEKINRDGARRCLCCSSSKTVFFVSFGRWRRRWRRRWR